MLVMFLMVSYGLLLVDSNYRPVSDILTVKHANYPPGTGTSEIGYVTLKHGVFTGVIPT